uniref:putative phospholipase B-like 2 n=1 Tax=Styela clava TaxID=7725 RepID=UPI0019395CE7|nr:putative phospholipase B-like 2 [Styela clava]
MALFLKSFLVILSIFCALSFCGKTRRVLFVYNEGKNFIEPHEIHNSDPPPPQWIVDVTYTDNVETTGWAVGEFTTNPDVDPHLQAYGAGYAEGYITSERIEQTWNNTLKGYCDSTPLSNSCVKIHDFVQDNIQWMLDMIKKNPDDKFWDEVNKGLLQVQGLEDGYKNLAVYNPTIRLKPFGFYLFQLGGDLEDLEVALEVEESLKHRAVGSGHCSALVKIVTDKTGKQDLFSAHDTWSSFESMLRIMKRYNFGSHSESFSGYPGSVFSGDDFYILATGLVTMETTNGNSNSDLWKYVTPETVPEWLRNIAANRLAKNGEEWCEIFSNYNSGTYNNQWMIVDYNEFEKQSKTGVLYVLEQLPGETVFDDVSNVLFNQTYWASYNIPYFPEIFKDSGQPAMVAKYGDWFTHDKNPRAKIFARDHKKVVDMNSLIKLMRYNDFKNDPISRCNCTPPYSAENSIAARCDLNPADGVFPFGALKQRDHAATDVKATSYSLQKVLGMMAESGPTHDQQPVFEWSKSPYANVSHLGMPDRFDFSPVLFVWDK